MTSGRLSGRSLFMTDAELFLVRSDMPEIHVGHERQFFALSVVVVASRIGVTAREFQGKTPVRLRRCLGIRRLGRLALCPCST